MIPEARHLGEHLRAPLAGHPWREVTSPGAITRFNTGRDPIQLTLVEWIRSICPWVSRRFRNPMMGMAASLGIRLIAVDHSKGEGIPLGKRRHRLPKRSVNSSSQLKSLMW